MYGAVSAMSQLSREGAGEGGTRAGYARRQHAALILLSHYRAPVQALPRLLSRRRSEAAVHLWNAMAFAAAEAVA